jgi:tRNA-Thr(GGU) m(6)t(6)A37 methyltransferase TsaA
MGRRVKRYNTLIMDAALPELKPIGVLESCFKEKFGTPRQAGLVRASFARLKVHARYSPGHSLAGLKEFSHVWLLSWFHLNTNKSFHPKIHPPRLKGGKIGVFASRSPHRPNPIGLSLARLEDVDGDTLYLSGIDLIDGTPILDIKPYLHFSDSAPDSAAGWVPDNSFPELEIVFAPLAAAELAGLGRAEGGKLEKLIAGALRHDPRNRRDRTQMRDGEDLEFFLCDREVHFTVKGGSATVTRIAKAVKFEKKFRRERPSGNDDKKI